MHPLSQFLNQPKSRKVAIFVTLSMALLPIPLAGIHKFYLGQPLWGIIYLLLGNTPIPRIACAIDAVWYFVQGEEQFYAQFNTNAASDTLVDSASVASLADKLKELNQLRQEGLVSDAEFEQKRRQLLDRFT